MAATPPASDADWTKLIPIVISAVALAQPWVIALVRKLWWRRTLIFADSGRIEVCFTNPFGSYLGLKGAVYSKNRSSFIKRLRVIVTHLDSGLERRLDAHLFKEPKITIGGSSLTTTQELAGPVYVKQDEAFSYYINFINFDDFNEIDVVAAGLKGMLEAFVLRKFGRPVVTEADRKELAEAIAAANAAGTPWYDEFYNDAANEPIRNRVRALCHWPAGKYRLNVTCEVEGDDRTYTKPWYFTLTPTMSSSLQNNWPGMFRRLCNVDGSAQAYFAYVRYESV